MKKGWIYLFILILPFSIVVVVNSISPPGTKTYKENSCTRYCHDHTCPHFQQKMALVKPGTFKYKTAKLYGWNIRALKNNGLGLSYAEINILLYVIFFPLFSVFLFWLLIKKTRKVRTITHSSRLPAFHPVFPLLSISPLYWYFVDFCINGANLLGTTYIEFNFVLFCVLFPLITIVLIFLNICRYLVLPIFRRKT